MKRQGTGCGKGKNTRMVPQVGFLIIFFHIAICSAITEH